MPKAASIEELLKSGAHFGHLTRRWNPKMKEFIFMQRNGIHIIDLKKAQNYLQEALDEIATLARAGKTILFVGTKKQSREIIKTEAIRSGMPFVTHRWLGGMLTNFSTVRKSISRMEEIDRMSKDGTFEELTKKEGLMLEREREKLENTLGGIANMTRLPGAIFVVDTIKEHIAVNEAVKLNIPIISLVDTNSDPDIPDYIIPCNDDSARTIQLITSQVADAIIEGNAEREAMKETELMEQVAEEGKAQEEDDKGKEEVTAKTRRRKRRRKEPGDELVPESDSGEGSEEESGQKEETVAEAKSGAAGMKTAEAAETEVEKTVEPAGQKKKPTVEAKPDASDKKAADDLKKSEESSADSKVESEKEEKDKDNE